MYIATHAGEERADGYVGRIVDFCCAAHSAMTCCPDCG
jgi:hypothetical protein